MDVDSVSCSFDDCDAGQCLGHVELRTAGDLHIRDDCLHCRVLARRGQQRAGTAHRVASHAGRSGRPAPAHVHVSHLPDLSGQDAWHGHWSFLDWRGAGPCLWAGARRDCGRHIELAPGLCRNRTAGARRPDRCALPDAACRPGAESPATSFGLAGSRTAGHRHCLPSVRVCGRQQGWLGFRPFAHQVQPRHCVPDRVLPVGATPSLPGAQSRDLCLQAVLGDRHHHCGNRSRDLRVDLSHPALRPAGATLFANSGRRDDDPCRARHGDGIPDCRAAERQGGHTVAARFRHRKLRGVGLSAVACHGAHTLLGPGLLDRAQPRGHQLLHAAEQYDCNKGGTATPAGISDGRRILPDAGWRCIRREFARHPAAEAADLSRRSPGRQPQ